MSGKRKPNNSYQHEFANASVSFDPEAFNDFLRNQGIRLVHYKALRCCIGCTDVDDNRRPHEDHAGCSNGFIYYKAGIVTAAMQGNTNSQNSNDMGLMESSYITVSFPQFYDDGSGPVTMAPFDRFFLDEENPETRIVVPTWHLQVANQTRRDRLYYPAVDVEKLVDMRGEEYEQGVDFCIEDGQVVWNSNRWPGYQIDVGRGAVYSIRYTYRPHWYCVRMLHEIRIAQVESLNGRIIQRLPQQALLAREHVFTNEMQDKNASNADSLRQSPEPESGGWGSSR